jgi:hypothetical protein
MYLIIHPIERLEYDTTLERISSTDILEFDLSSPLTIVETNQPTGFLQLQYRVA